MQVTAVGHRVVLGGQRFGSPGADRRRCSRLPSVRLAVDEPEPSHRAVRRRWRPSAISEVEFPGFPRWPGSMPPSIARCRR